MKKITVFIVCVASLCLGLIMPSQAQTNIFPTTGNVGIGTTSPAMALDVRGSLSIGGSDFLFGKYDNREQGQKLGNRALVHNVWSGKADSLIINYDGDFEGGVFVHGPQLVVTGDVGVGTVNPSHKLTVNGPIRAKEVIVDTGWADYVFAEDYQLRSLAEVEAHIKEHKHLPGVPSASKVASEGVSLGEMQTALLAKIEELTLHLIDLNKQVTAQAAKIEKLEAENVQSKQILK